MAFGHIAFRDGRAEWHAVLSHPAGTRCASPPAELRRRFRTWHDPIPALLDATRPETVLHHHVNEPRTPLPSYTVGRIALLGDAAHAMTPNLGQGARQALEDAVTLAAALATESTVEAPLACYDAERRPRSQAVARAARQAGRMGQQPFHPLAVPLRNMAMRLTPSWVATDSASSRLRSAVAELIQLVLSTSRPDILGESSYAAPGVATPYRVSHRRFPARSG